MVLPVGRSQCPKLEDLAATFYKQYQYNAELAPTRTRLQGMSMGVGEGFKDYAKKWRDLAGRVKLFV